MVEHETSSATKPDHRDSKRYAKDKEGAEEHGMRRQSLLDSIDDFSAFFAERIGAMTFAKGGQPCADSYGQPAAQVKGGK